MAPWWQQSPEVTRVIALASALALGLYVAIGPSSRPAIKRRRSKKKHFPPGLINSGNDCFVNAVLQALSSCSGFKAWLAEASKGHEKAVEDERKEAGVGKALLICLSALNNKEADGTKDLSPQELLQTLRFGSVYLITHLLYHCLKRLFQISRMVHRYSRAGRTRISTHLADLGGGGDTEERGGRVSAREVIHGHPAPQRGPHQSSGRNQKRTRAGSTTLTIATRDQRRGGKRCR